MRLPLVPVALATETDWTSLPRFESLSLSLSYQRRVPRPAVSHLLSTLSTTSSRPAVSHLLSTTRNDRRSVRRSGQLSTTPAVSHTQMDDSGVTGIGANNVDNEPITVDEQSPKRSPKRRANQSEVWDHFQKLEKVEGEKRKAVSVVLIIFILPTSGLNIINRTSYPVKGKGVCIALTVNLEYLLHRLNFSKKFIMILAFGLRIMEKIMAVGRVEEGSQKGGVVSG